MLNIDYEALRETTSGRIVSIFSTDLEKLIFLYPYFANFFTLINQFLSLTAVIWILHGFYSSLTCVSISLFISTFQSYMASKQGALRMDIAERSDNRILLMNEILSGMQTIKMQVWEKYFKKKIGCYRQKEILKSMESFLYKIVYRVFGTTGAKIPLIFMIMACKITNPDSLNPYTIMRLISFILFLERDFFYFMPDIIFLLGEFYQSSKRIEVYLLNK